MPVPNDTNPKLAAYAHPERLVTTEWLAEQLGQPGLAVVESDEDVLLYDTGHNPGRRQSRLAHRAERPGDQGLRQRRTVRRAARRSAGIGRDTTVVIYGDRNNWWAAYALWVFSLFGHQDVRPAGRRPRQVVAEGRELTKDQPTPATVDYPVIERDDSVIRAFKDDVLAHLRPADGRRALPR